MTSRGGIDLNPTTWHWDSGVCQEPGQIEDFLSRGYQSRMD